MTALALALGLLACGGTELDEGQSLDALSASGGRTDTNVKTLILYDTTGGWGFLGELHAVHTANLVAGMGSWEAKAVSEYRAGDIAQYNATIYLGTTYDEPLSNEFLDDVLNATKPVVWLYNNIWRLTARSPTFAADYGFMWTQYDTSVIKEVRYKSESLTRYPDNGGGIMAHVVYDANIAKTLATAVRADGTTFPWAIRAKTLTYVGELPGSYFNETDRLLAYTDILIETLTPRVVERHRALVRIEDVGPASNPQELRAMADALHKRSVPFSVAVIARHEDPNGAYSANRQPESIPMASAPAFVSALRYMVSKGGTLVMHGYTHQFGSYLNPYSGATADDFEFFMAHVDSATNNVIYDGPVPGNSVAQAQARIDLAIAQYRAVGLPVPKIWEFPHYAGSPDAYQAVASTFGVRYERSLYFAGILKGGAQDSTRWFGQLFPYPVVDAYGMLVLPENLGNYEPEPQNNHPARFPADLIRAAKANLVVRDGFASFFYHPYYPLAPLGEIVDGIKALGYKFVSATSLVPVPVAAVDGGVRAADGGCFTVKHNGQLREVDCRN